MQKQSESGRIVTSHSSLKIEDGKETITIRSARCVAGELQEFEIKMPDMEVTKVCGFNELEIYNLKLHILLSFGSMWKDIIEEHYVGKFE